MGWSLGRSRQTPVWLSYPDVDIGGDRALKNIEGGRRLGRGLGRQGLRVADTEKLGAKGESVRKGTGGGDVKGGGRKARRGWGMGSVGERGKGEVGLPAGWGQRGVGPGSRGRGELREGAHYRVAVPLLNSPAFS